MMSGPASGMTNTTRKMAILTAMHEGGHGIAAQRIPDEYYGMPIGTEPGMDMAEAESRLFREQPGS